MSDPQERKYSAPAAAAAADILLAFARSRGPLTLPQLVERTGCSRSLVYRTLRELEERELVSERPGDQVNSATVYQLGVAAIEIGGAYANATPFMHSARNVLRQLSVKTGETASLGIRRGSRVLYLMREEGNRSVFSVSQVGKTLPAHATGIGKALLSQLADGEIRELYAKNSEELSRPMTGATLTDLPTLLHDLQIARLNNYALEDGEVVEGRYCLGTAVPLFDPQVRHLGISVSSNKARYAEERDLLLRSLLQARQALTNEAQSRHNFDGGVSMPELVAQSVGGTY